MMQVWALLVLCTSCLLLTSRAHILLYDTDGSDSSQYGYCIYWMTNATMKYCVRDNMTYIFNTAVAEECFHGGIKFLFRDLVKERISPSEVNTWSSSVEEADNYAAFYYDARPTAEEKFLCKCTLAGTFGPRCEFELLHEAITFEGAIKAQFEQKEDDRLGMQQDGNILCYRSVFACDYGLLCLDWRDICDGQQQCMDGTDEENCDLLEFNECEDDEYRCVNGMCISADYWLDGDFDCMDRSDERWSTNGALCPYTPGSLDCEEGLCTRQQWSCGDGQCIQGSYRLGYKSDGKEYCANLREFNYMCEAHPEIDLWTTPDGLCWNLPGYDDPWDMSNENWSNTSKCIYLIRCALSNGFERDCHCNGRNCSSLASNVCDVSRGYSYPGGNLIRPYITFFYIWIHMSSVFRPHMVFLEGSVRCRGFHGQIDNWVPLVDNDWYKLDNFPLVDFLFCNHEKVVRANQSSMQYHPLCWNQSVTFNSQPYAFFDVCHVSHECLSQYRIGDGVSNCGESGEPAVPDRNLCAKLGKHRFQCADRQPTCLPVRTLGDNSNDCENRHDELVDGLTERISNIECRYRNDHGCSFLKDYVNHDRHTNTTHTSAETIPKQIVLPFRSYCDTFWDLPSHVDESLQHCQSWVCQRHQYQCRTGQCIELGWLCDGEWDCPEASDEQAAHLNTERLHHNIHLPNFYTQLRKCQDHYTRKQSFVKMCNVTTQFPCLLANVTDPWDIALNRPCIDLTQIGDEKVDCYGGLDEKNMLESCDGSMLGFLFRCGDRQCSDYDSLCHERSQSCRDEILCHHVSVDPECSDRMDVKCFDGSCLGNARCDGYFTCPHGEDEYWCPPLEAIGDRKYKYRGRKERQKVYNKVFWPSFPSLDQSMSSNFGTRNLSSHLISPATIVNGTRIRTAYYRSYTCNRGVAVVHITAAFSACFCPPSYYGTWCQYFSDRLTVVTHLDLISLTEYFSVSRSQSFKIVASLLYLERIIDFHEFHVNGDIEMKDYVKHRFYLLYPLSDEMRTRKKQRLFNRTDIINNRPYSIQFTVYRVASDRVSALGAWFYPVYFDFLPSFRLAIVLKFSAWYGNSSADPCSNNTSCPPNSVCRPIFNEGQPRFWCSCQSGFYGRQCENVEPKCSSYCSSNAFCKPMGRGELRNSDHPLCVCPQDRFGPRCYLRREECHSQPCGNNGTCHLRYDPSGQQPFICNCTADFTGVYCEQSKFTIQINLHATGKAAVSVIQLFDVDPYTLQLLIQRQQLITGFPTAVRLYHRKTIAPVLGVLKRYNDSKLFDYYILYIRENEPSILINSTPEYCPPVASLLSLRSDYPDAAVFQYHLLCRNDDKLFCFHDDKYLCIYEENHTHVDCFGLDTSVDQCNFCFSNGKCLRGDLDSPTDFICFCPRCSRGRRCEFTTYAFGFTLDSLLAGDSLVVRVIYTCTVAILVIFGLFTNTCSLVTFKQPDLRRLTVSTYLYLVSALNKCALFFLLCKFIHILDGFAWDQRVNLLSCKAISYLLFVSTRATFWLTSWITCDRLQTIIFPTSILFKRPNIAIGVSIATLIILGAMHIPDILYTTVAADACTVNFEHPLVSLYNRLNTLLHYLGTFAIQTLAITVLIILVARSRERATRENTSFRQTFKTMFNTKKELYVMPAIIILSAVPQTILSFSLSCSELSRWQRHMLLPAYLLSYAPQILGFVLFVLPSKKYRMDLQKTNVGQTLLFKWMLQTKHPQRIQLGRSDRNKTVATY